MLAETTGSNPTPFGFAGGEQYQTDTDSGLMLLGHRYYDNTTGRFISRDPAYAGDNWYAYCGNNPLGGTDASGLEPTEGTKVPDDKLKYAPIKRGLPPIGDDGNPIELHHRGRDPNGPVDEGTRTDHRGPGNHKMNHPGPNQGVDHGSEWKKWREDYWKREWDRGRFRGLPAIDAPEPQPYDNYMPPSDPSGYDPRYPITINWPVLGIVIISIISIGAGQPEGAAAGAVALKPALAN
jgi:RHS repeat-associated protein